MKLIEGMKRLRIIEKKMSDNTRRINEYAAIVSNERPIFSTPIFSTEDEQRKQIFSLLQANKDLTNEYLKLKKRVDLTNIQTSIVIGKETYTISDLLQIRRKLGKAMRSTYSALNDDIARSRLASNRQIVANDKPLRIERMYDENTKYEGLQHWQDLEDEIETRIEVINATTDLVEL